ncbi:Fur family transcriptional regulator [Agromyces salentinus]|uniref:Fur family transcriptional regulator n=1 Tax=Agromyces salentinus TaxID=269421 RepID=A0ABP4YYZ3_9MICO|nr:Fur family transcriptional regulator [Agromyces salentinus]
MTTDEIREAEAERLRSAGLRVTEPRLAVLAVVTGSEHLDAEAVHARVGVEHPGIPLQTVYNVLGDLSAAHLLRRIEPAGSAALYERRTGDNHHHVVCTRCGAVADVDCVVGHAPCVSPSDTSGFVVHTAEVTFWGLCTSCQQGEAAA